MTEPENGWEDGLSSQLELDGVMDLTRPIETRQFMTVSET